MSIYTNQKLFLEDRPKTGEPYPPLITTLPLNTQRLGDNPTE